MNAKKIFRVIGIIALIYGLLFLLSVLLINLPPVQTYLVKTVAKMVSSRIDANVSIGKVDLKFLKTLRLEEVCLTDQQQDTIIYAGILDLDIKAWSIIQRKFNMRKIYLKDAKVHLIRYDPIRGTNLSFGKEDSTRLDTTLTSISVDGKKKAQIPKIKLDQLEIENVAFSYYDSNSFTYLDVWVPKGDFRLKKLDLDSMHISIQSAHLQDPDVSLVLDRNPDKIDKLKPFKEDTLTHFLPGDMQIRYENMEMENASFQLNNLAASTYQKDIYGINFAELDVSRIYMMVNKGNLIADTIYNEIQHLSAKDKSGFELSHLEAISTVSTNEISCGNLLLITPHSSISDSVGLYYYDFKDFKDFENLVELRGYFRDAKIDFRDINYFARGSLDFLKGTSLCVNATVTGPLGNLKTKNLDAYVGNTKIKGRAKINGLPDVQNTYFNLDLDEFVTDYKDLELLYSGITYPKELKNLGRTRFTGRFDGYLSDFVANGKIRTQIGDLEADLHLMFDPEKVKPPSYVGFLRVDSFDIGQLIESEQFGKATFALDLRGEGFKLDDLNTSIKGALQEFHYNDYLYRGLEIDGQISSKLFNGALQIEDENIDLRFDGLVDFNDSLPKFKFFSNIRKMNLQALNLSKDDLRISSFTSIDLTGDAPDNITGEALLVNSDLYNNGYRILLDTVQLIAQQIDSSRKRIDLRSDLLNGYMEGRFSLLNIPNAVKKYIVDHTHFDWPDTNVLTADTQVFQSRFELKDEMQFSQLIHPEFILPEKTIINAYFDNVNDTSYFEMESGEIWYKQFKFKDLRVTEKKTFNDQMMFELFLGDLFVQDSLFLDQTTLDCTLGDSVSRFRFQTNEMFETNFGELGGSFTTMGDSFLLEMDPGYISINHKIWNFKPNNLAIITPRDISLYDLFLEHKDESVGLKTVKTDSLTDLILKLDNINLEDFNNLFLIRNFTLKGFANGSIRVNDVFNDQIISANLNIIQLGMNDLAMGDLHVFSRIKDDGYIHLTGTLTGDENRVDIYGYYPLRSDEGQEINLQMKCRHLNVEPFKVFLTGMVDEMKGYTYGELQLKGPANKPVLTGNMRIKDGIVGIDYLKTRYFLDDEEVVFKSYGIDFGNVTIRDDLNQTADVDGLIWHKNLTDWRLDIYFNTPRLHVLNTTSTDNETFYGNVSAEGSVLFKGHFNEISIEAYLVDFTRGSKISIPLSEGSETGEYSFFKFVRPEVDTFIINYGEQVKDKNLSVLLDLGITQNVDIDLIFDPATGEKLSVKGFGNVTLQSNENTDLDIYGLYEITDGEYLFRLQNLINKKFELEPGGSISFSGSIEEAVLNVSALYYTRASAYELIQEYLFDADQNSINRAKSRYPIELALDLTGELQQPDINFDLSVVDPDPLIRGFVENKLRLLELNENELNRQTFGILVLNRFLPSIANSQLNSTNPIIAGTSISTLSEFVSNQLSIYLTDWLSAFVTDLDFNVHYRVYDTEEEEDPDNAVPGQGFNRQEINLALSKRFFNDRLTINVGGNIDFGGNVDQSTGNTNTNTNFSQDFKVQYAITKDGRVVIQAFSRGYYDIFNQSNINRTGVGVSYREDFDDLKDLIEIFQKRKQNRRTKKGKPNKKQKQNQEETDN